MNKQEIYNYLQSRHIWHKVTEHKAVYNMSEALNVELLYPDAEAKNLFLRDDKKQCYYLVTVKGDKKVDLKALRHQNRTRPLSFASQEELNAVLGLYAGAVSPFGLLNDAACRVRLLIDEAFLEEPALIGVHPNENTATVWLKTRDLIKIIEEHGNCVQAIKMQDVWKNI